MSQPDPPAVPAPTDRIGFLIYRAGLLIAQDYEQRMRPLGFSPVEVGILTVLAGTGDSHVRALARALGVSPQTAVNVTMSLESRHLVRRVKSEADQRALLVSLTPEGLQALAEIDRVARAFDEEIAQQVGSAPAEAIVRGLRALVNGDTL